MARLRISKAGHGCTDIRTGWNNCPMFWLGLWADKNQPYAFGNLSALWPHAELLSDDSSFWPCADIAASECPIKCQVNIYKE